MKQKCLAVILIFSLTLLSGCALTNQRAAEIPGGSVLERIATKGELVVGTTGSMPLFNMTTKSGEIIGIDIDLAKRISNAMGAKLRLEIMPFADLFSALETGKVNLILSNMTITPERNMKVAFAGPYFTSGKAFLTKLETIAKAKKAEGVNNPQTRLAALKGSTSRAFVETVIPKAQLITTKYYDEAVSLVIEGKVDALWPTIPFASFQCSATPIKACYH